MENNSKEWIHASQVKSLRNGELKYPKPKSFADIIKQGRSIKLIRDREWVSISTAPEYDQNNEIIGFSYTKALWMYGTDKVGNHSKVSPVDVLDSQLQAHIDHGWQISAIDEDEGSFILGQTRFDEWFKEWINKDKNEND